MIIGFMTNFKNPTALAKLTAMLCKYQGMDLIYLRPRDVDIESGRVEGKMYINSTWVTVKVDIPPFIDIAPYCFKRKNREIMRFLRNKTFLSDNRSNVLSKEKLQEKLLGENEFAHLVIPTRRVQNFNDVQEFLDKHSTIVLKPSSGIRGRGVYILNQEKENYILGHQTEKKALSLEEFKNFSKENIIDKRYILQKYISSRTLQGDPFDCRIHVEKNGKGKWESAKNYIRIGIGQKVISNVNQGGGISDPKPFLKANFGDDWEKINDNLNKLAVTLPYMVEELRGTHIMSLGMDIGIDKSGKLYLFEVNDGPATASLKSEVAMLRAEYYKYIMKNLI
ncbi:YheC/YheD family protein [Virgibacillus alimentarius]|uniref:Glutathione synthase/RimK-type ligase-like ATP-grasp enzyme n=1 Tax=Virgibacillus alimentarius TaxID=698769 RepID=A0ABS4S7I6_9BACI|nr:YheC/YheD family protein [Virgibacillus alimentarius]MBP2257438.1 glutathione synthase/RimK-type ligase-like ATP-grasp enzyme [Virgibacillus alimentarius]